MFTEIRTDHVDDKGVVHIDGYKTIDDNEEGTGIGYFIHGEVYWRDPEYQFDPLVQAIVTELKKEQKPFVLDTIDYSKLKEQKKQLLYVIEHNVHGAGTRDTLTGLTNLIDAIQDFAVDVMGKSESEVFNLTEG